LAKQSKVHAFMVVMVLVAQNLSQYLKQVWVRAVTEQDIGNLS
jgi:hypothetical protein